jgi:hypothetical protein
VRKVNKNTKLLLIFILILTLAAFFFLAIFYDQEKRLIFHAEVKEVYPASAVIVPINEYIEELGYTQFVINITGVEVGDRIKVIAHPEIRETHPAMINIVSYEFIR